MKKPVNQFISSFVASFLSSFSQIMLQKNVVTGLLFVVGIGLNSPIMLLGATIAVVSALLVAQLFQYDTDSISSGLYGFNAALAGSAVFFFLPANLFSFTIVIFSGAISTVIMHLFLYFTSHNLSKLPVFTAPFIISTWLFLLFINMLGIDTVSVSLGENSDVDLYVVMRGIGQVMFQGYWLSGAIFIAGLCLHSYKVATWAVIGSTVGLIIARTFHFPEDLAHQGLYGFNASLTAIALAERFNNRQWFIFIGIVVSILFTRAFELITIPALTSPFVLASWLVILLARRYIPKSPEDA